MKINDNITKLATLGAFSGALLAIYEKQGTKKILLYAAGLAVIGAFIGNLLPNNIVNGKKY